MKRWYLWFVLAGIQVIGGILNYFDGKTMIGSLIGVGLFSFMGITQFLCERKGEKGQKIFRFISIAVCIVAVVALICLLAVAFDHFGKIV